MVGEQVDVTCRIGIALLCNDMISFLFQNKSNTAEAIKQTQPQSPHLRLCATEYYGSTSQG